MGIRVVFGAPTFFESGSRWVFVPWLPATFKCYLKRYTTGMFDLDYDSIEYMSKKDFYPKDANGKRINDVSEDYVSVQTSVESRAYLKYPRNRELLVRKDDVSAPVCFLKDLTPDELKALNASSTNDLNKEVVSAKYPGITLVLERMHPLVKIFRSNVPPEGALPERERLQDWSEEGMTSAVRAAGARITWKQANEDPAAFKDKVEENYLSVDGALIEAGFRPSGIKLAIKSVDPPESVKTAQADEEAAPHVAKKESIEVGDAITQMVKKQIEATNATLPANQKLDKAECLAIRKECLNQLTRDRTMKGGGKLTDNRIASADGTPFAQGSMSEIIGGIVAAVSVSMASKDTSGKGGGGKGNQGGGGQQGEKATIEDARRIYEQQFGKKPNW